MIAEPLLRWFERHGRSELPWRRVVSPYRTVVSEFMLQQTQVERVIPLFEAFVERWASFEILAAAETADVLRAWKGLGYNSRAVRLQRLAKIVVERFAGDLPRDEALLRELPGIGPYTARAIAAFAYGADVAAIDTNVRRVVHRTQLGVEWPPRASAAALDALAAKLVPKGRGHAFNSALMDLGASLCTARAPKCLLCPLREACVAAPIDPRELTRLAAAHAAPRSGQAALRFEETTRYLRGRVIDRLRALSGLEAISLFDLSDALTPLIPDCGERLEPVVTALVREGLVENIDQNLRLTR